MVVASFKSELLVISVLLLLNQLLDEFFAFELCSVVKVGFLTLRSLSHGREKVADCGRLTNIKAGNARSALRLGIGE